MVLGAATGGHMGIPHVALVMLDVNAHNEVEHAVLYDQSNGILRRLVSSYEAGPFDVSLDFHRWLMRALRTSQASPGSPR
jgi:hypothetical protein